MKNFFTSFLGTLAGLFVFNILIALIFVCIIGGIVAVASKDKTTKVEPNSVLRLDFSMPITERTIKNPFEDLDFSGTGKKEIGLNDIKANIEHAKEDENIKGIYIDMMSVPAGMATVEEIRNSLVDFKESGKFIIAYSEIYTQKAYYLASVADKIYVNPQGIIEWKGLGAQIMFFKNMMEKLEVEPQIFRHGKFKSAVEPFMLDKMSDANREQTMTYVRSIWDHMVEGVAKERKISVEELNKMADDLTVQKAEDAVKYKLADGVKYKDEILDELKDKLGLESKEKVHYVNITDYSDDKKISKEKQKIAVVYAVGQIEGGNGDDDETMGSDRISKAIRQARQDSNVKAIVLRVNSPGGSALASDVIWREMVLAKKAKTVIVSMGDVAASGGYYIACAADKIVCQPNTITGSIGVFGMFPVMEKLFKNKFGITVDTVNTNNHSDFGNPFRQVKKEEGDIIQHSVENIYDDFIAKVAEGRKKEKASIDSIGQGRVWSGVDALKIGLVDTLGGIEDAIAMAARMAKLDKYKIQELPALKDPLESLFKNAKDDAETKLLKENLGDTYELFIHFKQLMNMKGVQMRLPYEVILN